MKHRKYRPATWLALVALAAAAGCGASGQVAGRVTYNGDPLDRPGGRVVFVGPNGEQTVAAIGADGSYTASGVPRGPHRVAVYYPNPDLPEAGDGRARKRKPGDPPPPPPFLTPAKYASPDTSGLSVVVDRRTAYDIPLAGPPVR